VVGVRCVLGHASLEVGGQQCSPGLGVDGSGDLVLVDEKLLEEELVGQSSDLWATASVQFVTSMRYSTTWTGTTLARVRLSAVATISERNEPSSKRSSTGQHGVGLGAPQQVRAGGRGRREQRMGGEPPVGQAQHPSRSSSRANVTSPVRYAPIAAANNAWVPHSATATSRSCGNAPTPSPRPEPRQPNAASLSTVSATSRHVPSMLTSRQSR